MTEPGREAKRLILQEVYAREQAGQRWPTTRELAVLLDKHYSTISLYIKAMIEVGLLERDGYALRLSPATREMMDLEIGT